jgi:hypothetical protein
MSKAWDAAGFLDLGWAFETGPLSGVHALSPRQKSTHANGLTNVEAGAENVY